MFPASIDDRTVEWAASHRFGRLNGFFITLATVEKLGLIWIVIAFVLGLLVRAGSAPLSFSLE
jgi:hypothetical protein